MGGLLAKIQASPWLKSTLMLAILAGACAGAFWWGQKQGVTSRPPLKDSVTGMPVGDYDKRVVAYLFSDVPVSRAELGEYLIARFGAERLEFLVNRKIVEMEAAKAKVHVSDDEVEARFKRDLYSFNPPLTEHDFVNTILKRFQKNLYEWKEDVIRPKVMMEKIVEGKVVIKENDLQEGFEARYGPRVECRMIVLDPRDMGVVQKIHADASKSPAAFIAAASKSPIPNLAQSGGKVPPIHKHFGDAKLEEAAFALKEGQISGLITLKDGTYVMLMCEKRLPADASVNLDKVRIRLAEEMKELRIAQRIPEEFSEMRKRANPWLLLNTNGQQQVVPMHGSGTPVPAMPVSRQPDPPNLPPAPVPGATVPKVDMPAAPTPKAGTPTIADPPPAPIVPLPKSGLPVAPKEAAPVAPKTPVPAPAPVAPSVGPTGTPLIPGPTLKK